MPSRRKHLTVSTVPIQTQVMGVLKKHTAGMTAAAVAQALGLSPELVAPVLENLYVSSQLECRRLGEILYRVLPRN